VSKSLLYRIIFSINPIYMFMFRGMQNDVTVTIYYHFQEIGRSPNTMHLMPLLAPSLCKSLIFGDVEVSVGMSVYVSMSTCLSKQVSE
jgi:hypothetical protein